jgi:hypothetical protein
MPTPHRRIGLVLDEGMSSAFDMLREQAGPALPEAGLARKAVYDGVALSAVLHAATTRTSSQEAARQLLRDMRALLRTMSLPMDVRTAVLEEIDRASADAGVQERRRRQLALLESPNPYGRATLDVTDSIDALDREPA